MAPRQNRLGRWLDEVESSENTQGSRVSTGRLLAWLGERLRERLRERLVEYRTLISSARRVHRNPLAQQKCSEERNPIRSAAPTRIWHHGRGRGEPCGII